MNTITKAACTAPAWLNWIRPWYVGVVLTGGHFEGHIYPDCERLLRITSEPQEGAGWLDPADPRTCGSCQERHDAGEEPPR
ncbi:hypothetical protein [Nonomuraea gerenzanensis]|uniref:Uncharacterized protein n=1 Tax=Nonomuraea gerenzanensis TaxID=93944 RepID=A0A1M4BKW3_9ACTN|nr:hypothetical protein [Nonomuraea gerenzanensis]UBU10006.1 hypothetical protein LCN96_37395 [Nonomuraea gerenzanensis]SAP16285.1 hypothetical protein BN4615_P10948 [Nonomuraea gerenzanensis]